MFCGFSGNVAYLDSRSDGATSKSASPLFVARAHAVIPASDVPGAVVAETHPFPPLCPAAGEVENLDI